jgi:hypothetical protein
VRFRDIVDVRVGQDHGANGARNARERRVARWPAFLDAVPCGQDDVRCDEGAGAEELSRPARELPDHFHHGRGARIELPADDRRCLARPESNEERHEEAAVPHDVSKVRTLPSGSMRQFRLRSSASRRSSERAGGAPSPSG